ncbi:MAG: CFI-box-CTERM domain-containing protein, partial [Chloroflexota bacterium]|nr:CFI-box-CTERM domain-containing protein [Chloroflexota bacterium]
VFISKFSNNLTTLTASTFLGGSVYDCGQALAIDSDGNLFVTGDTDDAATDLPTTAGAYDTTHNGYNDVFISKFTNNLLYAGITVTPTTGLITTEAGGTDTFTVKLQSEPNGDVVIDVVSSDTTEGTVSPAYLTFDASNWSGNQTVTVTGADDDSVDGNQSYTIQLTIDTDSTTDTSGYAGLDPDDVSVTNTDDDTETTTSGGGCFIATAAYGSLMEPYVEILRDFRDQFLLTNSPGRIFVDTYYAASPPIADFIANYDSLRAIVRLGLLPLVGLSWLLLNLGPFLTFSGILLLRAGLIEVGGNMRGVHK